MLMTTAEAERRVALAARRGFPTRTALGVVALLAALDALARLTFWGRSLNEQVPLRWFMATAEGTVPTVFAAGTMLFVGFLCLRQHPRARLWWFVTGLLFCYLAVDDAFSLHETLGAALYPYFGDVGVYTWVFTLGPVLVALGVTVAWQLTKALAHDPVRRRFLWAGFAALGVAVGIEIGEEQALQAHWHPRGIPLISYTQWVEEMLEMLGPVLLARAAWPEARRLSVPEAAG